MMNRTLAHGPDPTHPTLTRRPVSPSRMPDTYDPWRRLIARYATQALCDYYWPLDSLEDEFRASAREFVESKTGQEIIFILGIPVTRVRAILRKVAL